MAARVIVVITERSKGNFDYAITGDRDGNVTKNEITFAKFLAEGLNNGIVAFNSSNKDKHHAK